MNPINETSPGSPFPLGTKFNRETDSLQFAIFTRNAYAVSLLLFASDAPDSAYNEIKLDPAVNRTGNIWHICIKGLKERQVYGYRIDGPYKPENGHRFNKYKVLLDPYSKAISANPILNIESAKGFDPDSPESDLSISDVDNISSMPRSIAIDSKKDMVNNHLNIPYEDTIIYEMHIKGFTYHNSSGVNHPGTYRGVIEKIPYLKELGVTSLELLPVYEFNENENRNINPLTGEKLKNYWGYSTMSYFAPKGSYSSAGHDGGQVGEFKEMVRLLHSAGIEVILDVVYNHTAELDQLGPTLSFRGIENSIYYILESNKRLYKNFSGCGNTLSCNHFIVQDLIIDSLKYWVFEMGVDGFRFDLASILARDQAGTLMKKNSLIERIEEEPSLRDIKIISEAWDAAGAYLVGEFPGRWREWNGRYRDDIRKYWRSDYNSLSRFATRLTGSSDLYGRNNRTPLHSINFITCHDGFTLNDLVCFRDKHNIENGENNNDGENNNLSTNYGIEGLDATPYIEDIRNKQIKNFLATLFLSQGVPMLTAGDEFKRTQGGNNNAYCQDNEISWMNWDLLNNNPDIFRFCKEIIRFRKEHPLLRKKRFFTGKAGRGQKIPDITWHGIKINEPDWAPSSHFIACLLNGNYSKDAKGSDNDIYIAFNASLLNLNACIPAPPSGGKWMIAVDTSRPSPHDIRDKGEEALLPVEIYNVKRLSILVLISSKT